MKLDNLRSIHYSEPTISAEASITETKVRKTKNSPYEEFQVRRESAKLERIPDALSAILMREFRTVKIEKNGISFEVNGTKYTYWHPESSTCNPANLGKSATLTFDRDCLDVIYILNQGAYVETIPQKNKVKWFSPEVAEEIATHQRVINSTHALVKKAHSKSTKELYEKVLTNREKIQSLHSMTAPQAPEASTSRFAAAERINAANTDFDRQKEKQAKNKKRIRATQADLNSLNPQAITTPSSRIVDQDDEEYMESMKNF